MARRATDPELEEFAAFLARLTLEVERNLRDPDQLLKFMPARTWQQWQQGRLPGGFQGGAVVKSDIGRPRIQRVDELRALANVVTRTEATRWGALTMKLDATAGRWQAASIQRLYAAHHYRTGPAPTVVELPVEQRLATARADRSHATAANRAIDRRLGELPAGSDAHREVGRLSTTWKKVVADLDREIATLQPRDPAGLDIQRSLRRQR